MAPWKPLNDVFTPQMLLLAIAKSPLSCVKTDALATARCGVVVHMRAWSLAFNPAMVLQRMLYDRQKCARGQWHILRNVV